MRTIRIEAFGPVRALCNRSVSFEKLSYRYQNADMSTAGPVKQCWKALSCRQQWLFLLIRVKGPNEANIDMSILIATKKDRAHMQRVHPATVTKGSMSDLTHCGAAIEAARVPQRNICMPRRTTRQTVRAAIVLCRILH